MSIIRVTATAVWEYDTEEGLVSTLDEAEADVQQHIANGHATVADFTIEGEEV